VLARRRRGLEELTDDTPLLGEGLGKR